MDQWWDPPCKCTNDTVSPARMSSDLMGGRILFPKYCTDDWAGRPELGRWARAQASDIWRQNIEGRRELCTYHLNVKLPIVTTQARAARDADAEDRLATMDLFYSSAKQQQERRESVFLGVFFLLGGCWLLLDWRPLPISLCLLSLRLQARGRCSGGRWLA